MRAALEVTRSRPANGASAGGDVAVVRHLADGRVVLAVADVCGHGAEVAPAAAAVEATLTDAAGIGLAPAYALALLDAQLAARGEDELATAAYAVLDPATGTVVCASAGHPPLLLVADGYAELLPVEPGPPLGLEGTYAETTLAVAAGTVLLAYSDGLVERRDEDIDTGLARLVHTAAAQFRPGVHGLVDRVFAALAGDHPGDDVLLTGVAVPAAPRSLRLPSPRVAVAREGSDTDDAPAVRSAPDCGGRGGRSGHPGRRRLCELGDGRAGNRSRGERHSPGNR